MIIKTNKNIKIKYDKNKAIIVLLDNKLFFKQELLKGMSSNDCFLITLSVLYKFGLIYFDNDDEKN